MAKYYGEIGYGITNEIKPGVWKMTIDERTYRGDIIQNTQRMQSSETLNDNLNISNKISIIADPYANENFQLMVYASFMGAKWKITNIEVLYPRLLLTIGGLYNAE